jgi:hypothetical protein
LVVQQLLLLSIQLFESASFAALAENVQLVHDRLPKRPRFSVVRQLSCTFVILWRQRFVDAIVDILSKVKLRLRQYHVQNRLVQIM